MKNKKIIIFITFLMSVMFINNALAHGDDHDEDHEKKEVMVSGHLIGMRCFVGHGGTGLKHKDCFVNCAKKGLPLGILTKQHKIYQIVGEGHTDLITVNKKFIKYAEQNVMVKGEVTSSNGVNFIVVNKIKKM